MCADGFVSAGRREREKQPPIAWGAMGGSGMVNARGDVSGERGSGGAYAGHGVVAAEFGGGAEEFAEARHHFLRLLEGVEVYVGYR